jgi:tryptophan synthase alpha chain
MNRLEQRMGDLRTSGSRALTLFLTAGFPEKSSTVDLVLDCERAGADVVEIGMPFSDPLADGPVIQKSSARALANGVTIRTIFDDVRKIRSKSDIPLVLMGYVNPVLRIGAEKFFTEAAAAGVDGVIFPEIPLEESSTFLRTIVAHGMSNIMLVTPTSPPDRIRAIDGVSGGFLYCVSMTGVTGGTKGPPDVQYLRQVKSHATRNPVLVGFGIATPDDVRRVAPWCDGVIVGSALLRKLGDGTSREELLGWVGEMKRGLIRPA